MIHSFSLKKAVACFAVSTIAWAGYNSDYIPLAQAVAPPAIAYLLNSSQDTSTKPESKDK
ncbi:hypothetical protein [Nostoc sp. FACHB-110]|uniref:hypothetical protein n=1 Tax=Nostoc sp. FACHB-110 TaxID=2692834 RepID=UPI0019A2268D|nr:hypothetical protein [Nostoc sp. FACHB-110]MBD2440972.1 hypothetical protein [Nostoc sp. FACHB-110]MBD2441017.1 hypothetical protein [Nostoc sp. FACHB-110]